ncbi:metalloregulator ArsR/SmtB family transcription factor [Marinobacter adhaerens]|uniref:Metalloregulator ArsR/SmtB family transcription factor n=1 Tax=Marinobacter adhaerens TaxID=1033846 RepID=A0A851HN31_9GAMM|nr:MULTISPECIES: metalloregulator ArsR/SmtB family transcription factor [Marinobacter]NWN90140.1 metalloregulator ArsR/SmtB family transcription factor [Marinobacter adhaerens]
MRDKGVLPESDTRGQPADFSPVTLFRALSDELRLTAMLLIRDQKELCVCELTEAFAVSQPKVSRHLAILRETALVATERRGQWVYYSVNPRLPQWVFGVLDETARSNTALLESPLAKLQAMAERPAVSCP